MELGVHRVHGVHGRSDGAASYDGPRIPLATAHLASQVLVDVGRLAVTTPVDPFAVDLADRPAAIALPLSTPHRGLLGLIFYSFQSSPPPSNRPMFFAV